MEISNLAALYLAEMDLTEKVDRGLKSKNAQDRANAEATIARANRAVAEIETRLVKMHNTGELKNVNKSYREQRLARKAEGRPMLSYVEFMRRYKIHLLQRMCDQIKERVRRR